jgi:anti-sigma regulatory factor (Ser/Thr protein kinase)
MFFDHDDDAVADVAAHVETGLALGEHVVLVVTRPHRAAIDTLLALHGLDLDAVRAEGRLVSLDAADTLARFMVNDVPHPALFHATVGGLLDDAAAAGAPVRVFGEMVALLWEVGNVSGAIELEGLWNDIAVDRDFTLLCAYPTANLGAARLREVGTVCDMHSEVVPPASYGLGAGSAPPSGRAGHTAVFVSLVEAIPAVRRFVSHVLSAWGEDDLQADVALVTSEMATNSVVHAKSPFRARVDRTDDVIRVTIEDIGAGHAEARSATLDDLDGRGVQIIDALAHRWGSDVMVGGKTVWAEFPARAPRHRRD